MSVLPVCISMYHIHAWFLQRLEEDFRFLRLELQTNVNDHLLAEAQTQVLCGLHDRSKSLTITPML